MKTQSKATQTGLRSALCRSNAAKKRSGAARARVLTLDSAAPAGMPSNLLRLLQPLARNRFIAGTSRNHGANNNTPPSLLPVAPTPPAPARARRARNRFGAMGGRRADRTPSTHGFGHAVGVPGSAYPEPYSRSPNGGGEGVNRYFPAGIESRRPREQLRLETEFVCASERRRSRGGLVRPAARTRRGRSWANPWPTGGWGSRAVRPAFPRRPHVWLSCPHVTESSRNEGRSPCLFPVSRPMCVQREREQRTPRTRRRPRT